MDVNETDLHENISERLRDLLEYVHYLGRLNVKPVFMVAEYKQLCLWEHQLKGRIGIQHDLTDKEDGSAIWLRIDRLKRVAPPPVPEKIQEWLTFGNDPEVNPLVKETVIKTLPDKEAKKLLENGVVNEEDVREPLKQIQPEIKLKDVIFRLKNLPEIKDQIDTYLNEHWLLWSEEEKPRRKTIKIYDSLFSLQQTIESHGDEQPIELIWGIGVGRWLCEGHKIDYPLLEKAVEIEIDENDGSLLIRPRNIEPSLAINAYFALDNPGIEALSRFNKKHFEELSEGVEFSPYIHESFEPVLRQASAPQVKVGPFSIDLVVEGEKDRRLAIELDGDKYHPPEKWMEDWKRQRTMERVNWQFWRCWGSSYTLDPDGCIEDLVNTLNSLGIDPIGKSKRANIYTEHRVYKQNTEVFVDSGQIQVESETEKLNSEIKFKKQEIEQIKSKEQPEKEELYQKHYFSRIIEVQPITKPIPTDGKTYVIDSQKTGTPSVIEWVEKIPDLLRVTGLSSWQDICDHLGIPVEGDSARRRLKKWVKRNRPNWPTVPEPK